jgi:orotate phosphoribosyltransferase
MSSRDRLRQIIAEKSFKQGTFKLASGKSSNYYFNLKPTMLDPEGIGLVAELMLEKAAGLDADYIGGMAMGAVPVVVAATMKSHGSKRPLKGFWVRKEQKDHGAESKVDGYLVDGSNVIMVEDATTTGGSAMQAITEVRRHNCKVVAVLTIVDRLEGAEENLKKEGIPLMALFTTKDFAK